MKTLNGKWQTANGPSLYPQYRDVLTIAIQKGLFCLLLSAFCVLSTHSVSAQEVTKVQRDEVGKELACMCGTCPRRPLDECTCGYAQQQHARIDNALAQGKTKQQIIDAYIAEFGKEILSKPPAEGFNLLAWVMPPFVLLVGFFAVRNVLHSWSKSKPERVATPTPTEQDPYLERLNQELRERES